MVAGGAGLAHRSLIGGRAGKAGPAGRRPGRHGHSHGPAGWVWLGRLQPRPLCLLHPLDHRSALHGQRPRDPPVLPASGIRSYHPRGSRAAAAAIYRCFYNVCHVEEQETHQEIRLKAQLRRWGGAHAAASQPGKDFSCSSRQTSPRCPALSCSHVPSCRD